MKEIKDRLDDLYANRRSEYYDYLQTVKDTGHRVFRNSEGRHLVDINTDYMKEVYGGAFRKIFGG